MIIRKATLLLASYGNTHSLAFNASRSSTSSGQHIRSTRHQRQPLNSSKKYATIAGDHDDHSETHEQDRHPWPTPLSGKSCPTPYQIFAMKRNATYSKTRFYELVKIYHPDRNGTSEGGGSGIPHIVRIERYRLIVAAHNILSDPTKRSAYDRFGAGWDGRAAVGGNRSPSSGEPGPFSQNWSDSSNRDDPIWRNATWEDWQRYYAWKNGTTTEGVHRQKQAPVYFQNSYFMFLVVLLAMMGGTANYNRAQENGTSFVERKDMLHDQAAKELRRVRQEASGGSRQDRIDWFMRNREATRGIDSEAAREERAGRLLPNPEVCKSDEIGGKEGG